MHAITLLKSALSLLFLLSYLGNNVPPDVHDAVISVSNRAIAEAVAEIQAAEATSTPATPSTMKGTHATRPSINDAGSAPGAAAEPSVATSTLSVYKAVYEVPDGSGGGDTLYIWGSQNFTVASVSHENNPVSFQETFSADMGESCIYSGDVKKCGGIAKRITTTPAVSSFSGSILNVTTDSGLVVPIAVP